MSEKYLKYEPVITKIVSKIFLTMHGQRYDFDKSCYTFFYSKKMPIEGGKNRSSRVLEIRLSDEFVEDNGSEKSLESQITNGLKLYNPEPSDSSTYVIIIASV